jgi:hypothetical protein
VDSGEPSITGAHPSWRDVAFAQLASKSDLRDLELRLTKFIFMAMATQTALIVALIELLK